MSEGISHRDISGFLLFSIYTFLFMTAESLMNSMLSGVASDGVRNNIYFAQQISLLLGFLIISTQMQTHKLLMKRNMSVAISVLFAAGFLMLYM